MYTRLKKLSVALMFCTLWSNAAFAFDVISGGGSALLSQPNVDNTNKELLSDLLLTTNTAVTTETVTLTIPAGTGTLEFSTDPVAMTSTSGNFVVENLTQTTASISFDITGSGTLSVANIGLYGTNFGSAFTEDRNLNVNFQTNNFNSDFFHIDTRDFALGFGGGKQLNSSHGSSASALSPDNLVLVANTALASERVIITFDDGAAFTTPAVSSLGVAGAGDTLAATTLDSLNDFADGDIITVSNATGGDSTFTVSAANTVTDLETFLNGLTNLTAVFDDPLDSITLTANQDYTITSDGALSDIVLNFTEAAHLQFVETLPNFVVINGSLTLANVSISADTLQFDLTGTGELQLQGLQFFADNLTEKGDFFETRNLNVNALSTNFLGDTFVVDTIDYGARVDVNGATGGEDNSIFIIDDVMSFTFAPFDYSARFSGTELDLSAFGGNTVADFTDTFTVVSDDDDGAFTAPLTVAYAATNVKATYNTVNLTLDNQIPTFNFTNHNLLVLPDGKTVGGINDILTLDIPDETSGDTITFTADFSSVAGSIANFINAPATDTSIALQEVAIDTATFAVNITFADDAGNTLPTLVTNQVSLDLIRPVLATSDVISINGGPAIGTIGNVVQVDLPVDTAAGGGDTITYDLDLSALGSTDTNFTGISDEQSFLITPGMLNDEAFTSNLTIYDKALNSVSAVTNALQIDNLVPTFDTTCGATFQVMDSLNEGNEVADLTNYGLDSIQFLLPDKTAPGCDFDSFSVDLRAVAGYSVGANFENTDADGTSRTFLLQPGNLDTSTHQFPITIFDVNGNKTNFLTGSLNVDQDLIKANQIDDRSSILSNVTTNGAVLPEGKILVNTSTTEADIIGVKAQIEGATAEVELSQVSNGAWQGVLTVQPGFLEFEPLFITYTFADDAGNSETQLGNKVFYITNDTRERGGGGGGSQNFSNISKKSTLQRFTPSQSREFHTKNTAIKVKTKAQLRLESLKRRMTYPSGTPSRIVPKPESLIDQQRAAWNARQAALKADGQPKKVQHALERLALNKEEQKQLPQARDDAGEFRFRSTLDNLKNAFTPKQKVRSFRKVAPNHRGKYLEIQR